MSRKRYPRNTVFYGHGIDEPANAPTQSAERVTNVSPADLDDFLTTLGSDGVITFDDGYLDNLTTALPILEKHSRKATVFVTCGFIDGSHPPMERVAGAVAIAGDAATATLARLGITNEAPDARYRQVCDQLKVLSVAERSARLQTLMHICETDSARLTRDYLDLEQLQTLADHPLICIGAHTLTHPDLRYTSDGELTREMADARTRIEAWVGRAVTEMAYPYGDTDPRVRRAAAAAGYKRAYLVEQPNWRSHVPRYGRLDIPRVDLSTATRRMRKQQRQAAERGAQGPE